MMLFLAPRSLSAAYQSRTDSTAVELSATGFRAIKMFYWPFGARTSAQRHPDQEVDRGMKTARGNHLVCTTIRSSNQRVIPADKINATRRGRLAITVVASGTGGLPPPRGREAQ